MNGFTDIHAHFLYGLDDGARTRAEMEAMLDAANADGVISLFATPHMTPGVRYFDGALAKCRLDEARSYCKGRNYALRLYSGAEVMSTPMMREYVRRNRLPTLGGGKHVLVEFMPDAPLSEMEAAADFLSYEGYEPVFAHIERYKSLAGRAAYKLKEKYRIKYQVNCGTILNSRGFFVNWRVHNWLKDALIDYIASDAHNCRTRPSRMREAYQVLAEKYGQGAAGRMMGVHAVGS